MNATSTLKNNLAKVNRDKQGQVKGFLKTLHTSQEWNKIARIWKRKLHLLPDMVVMDP